MNKSLNTNRSLSDEELMALTGGASYTTIKFRPIWGVPLYGIQPCYGIQPLYGIMPKYGISPKYGITPKYGIMPNRSGL